MRSRCTLVLSILLALVLSRPAAAQVAGAPRPSSDGELTTLEQQLALAATVLSTGGCVVACPALASMARAAERICALDPGPRCADARARVRDASRRVHEACPECRTGVLEAPPPTQAAQQPEPPGQPPPPPAPPVAEAELLRTAPGRGGCAGCVVGAGGAGGGAGALAAVGVLAALARRRGRSRRR